MQEDVIKKILSKDPATGSIFLGVFARNELPFKPPYPSCFILNTDPRDKEGEHWLAFHYSKKGFCSFFDSYGQSPDFYGLEDYISKTSNFWSWNRQRLQGRSNFCGYYAVLYLLYKTRKKTSIFFKEFYLNNNKNDKKIFETIKQFQK